MSPVNKKSKKESTEKELEGFLFADNNDDVWDKTGHELDPKLEKSDEEASEEEGDAEEVLA